MSRRKKVGYYQRQFRVARDTWSKHSPDRKDCFLKARIKIVDNNMYKWCCAHCSNLFALSEVQCDHIEPISKNIPTTIEEYTQLFLKLESKNLQILCKSCHNIKTRGELVDRNKDKYIFNIFSNFHSISHLYEELVKEELSELKLINKIINDFKEKEDISEQKRKKNSTKLNNFLKKFER